jgi:hypothetical protein
VPDKSRVFVTYEKNLRWEECLHLQRADIPLCISHSYLLTLSIWSSEFTGFLIRTKTIFIIAHTSKSNEQGARSLLDDQWTRVLLMIDLQNTKLLLVTFREKTWDSQFMLNIEHETQSRSERSQLKPRSQTQKKENRRKGWVRWLVCLLPGRPRYPKEQPLPRR